MKTIIANFIFLILIVAHLKAQDFKTTITAYSGNEVDSVVLGFDSTATILIDDQFGEIDISSDAFSSNFEIRAGQIKIDLLDCEGNVLAWNPDVLKQMSKIDIVPWDCSFSDTPPNTNSMAPITTLFIKSSDLPVTLKWDSTIFDNVCLEGSIITDWHPGGWFDAGCPELSVEPTLLVFQDSVLITDPGSLYLVDNFGDTISMFYIAFGGYGFLDNVSEQPDLQFSIYPNPFCSTISIDTKNTEKINSIKIYNSIGELIKEARSTDNIDLSNFPNGTYIIKITTKESEITRMVIKSCQ